MGPDRVTANLPSRDFGRTEAFYRRLGFETVFRDEGWMILRRGPFEIEFFPHPGLNPAESAFSACLRLRDIDGLRAAWAGLGLPDDRVSIPRMTGFLTLPDVPRMFCVIDPDGTLLRCLQEPQP